MADFLCPAISPAFRVTFYKVLIDPTGHSHECPQGAVEVRATDDQEAIRRASQTFAQNRRVSNWRLRADYAKTERIG